MQIIATSEGLGGKCATITWEISRMLDEAIGMREQFGRYAYVITAFGTAQRVGSSGAVAPGYVLTSMQRAEYTDVVRVRG
jgi:hypothetical protein